MDAWVLGTNSGLHIVLTEKCCRSVITLELYENDFEMGLYPFFLYDVWFVSVFVFVFVFCFVFFMGLHLSEFLKCVYDINQGPRL